MIPRVVGSNPISHPTKSMNLGNKNIGLLPPFRSLSCFCETIIIRQIPKKFCWFNCSVQPKRLKGFGGFSLVPQPSKFLFFLQEKCLLFIIENRGSGETRSGNMPGRLAKCVMVIWVLLCPLRAAAGALDDLEAGNEAHQRGATMEALEFWGKVCQSGQFRCRL